VANSAVRARNISEPDGGPARAAVYCAQIQAGCSSRMRSFIYKANFCAECGNRLGRPRRARRRWWQGGCFCPECAARMWRRRYLPPLFAVLSALLVGLLLSPRRQAPAAGVPPAPQAGAGVVSAWDATAGLKSPQVAEPVTYAICGAQTRKGTPCKRRVRTGRRCAQHLGRPSLIKE
jgi:hypothetical protein